MAAPVEIKIEGMHCIACAQGIERRLQQSGIAGARVDFASAVAEIPALDSPPIEEAIRLIRGLGYKVPNASAPEPVRFSLSIGVKVLIAIGFALPLLLHMLVSVPWLHNQWVQLVLSAPPVALGLSHFGPGAWRSIRARFPGMDVLISLGILASLTYSLAGTLLGLGADYLFYETAAAISAFALLGGFLESRAVSKTQTAVAELTRLQATTAKKVETTAAGERIVEISAEQIREGDVLQLNTGDAVPADGLVSSGEAAVDEAAVTGESVPVHRQAGEPLIGGTTVVEGILRMQVTASGNATLLSRIIALVREAQGRKPAIQRLGDIWSARFVPVVLVISGLTLGLSVLGGIAFQDSLLRAVAVLVIACPCAMGLATPTALIVALGRAAKSGVLFKGGDSLERLAEIRTFIFDKTGTLTRGELELEQLEILDPTQTTTRIQSLIHGLERHSSHPIAKSLVRSFSQTTPATLKQIEERKGLGITAITEDGKTIAFGSKRFFPKLATETFERFDLLLVENDRPLAGLVIRDTPRPEAADLIKLLHQDGIHTVLLSGDEERKCREIAERLGIEQVFARKLPDEKVAIVEELEAQNRCAFFGDGVNDSAALARVSTGISLSDATGAAINSADVVLLGGDITRAWTAILLARRTLKTIKENLFWAFFYNVLSIPLAALGFMNPILAALAMAFSDVVVVGNSLRLRVVRIK